METHATPQTQHEAEVIKTQGRGRSHRDAALSAATPLQVLWVAEEGARHILWLKGMRPHTAPRLPGRVTATELTQGQAAARTSPALAWPRRWLLASSCQHRIYRAGFEPGFYLASDWEIKKTINEHGIARY